MFLKVYPPALCKKYAYTGQMDKSQKTVSELIIAGSDAAKFFQFQEKGLYQMPFLIKPPIHIPGIGFIVLGRDTEISTMVGYEVNREITGSGHVIGTLKHTEFKKLVDDLHIPSLYTEISYYHEEIKPYGYPNSIRFDVLLYRNNIPIHAWDFKTGIAKLTSKRISIMQEKSRLHIPIDEIR